MKINDLELVPLADLPILPESQWAYLIAADPALKKAGRVYLPDISAAAAAVGAEVGKIVSEGRIQINASLAAMQLYFEVLSQQAADQADFILASLGYIPPVDYQGGILVESARTTVTYQGTVYAANQSYIPFTTTADFDPAKWRVIQGVTYADIALNGGDAVGVDPGTGRSVKLSEFLSHDIRPEWFFIGNDRQRIQSALDWAGILYAATGIPRRVVLDGSYVVDTNPASSAVTGEYAAGKVCLNVSSGTTVCGTGKVTLAAGDYGTASGAIFGNWTGAIQNVHFKDLTIDGNRSGVTSGLSNVNLLDGTNITYEGVTSINAAAGGIYTRGTIGNGYCCRNVKVLDCTVLNCGYIGIQVERADGLLISGNTVDGTGDNGIDIYGNDAAGGQYNAGIGRAIRVVANDVRNTAMAGLFLESMGNAIVSQNCFTANASYAIFCNRINSGALEFLISTNLIKGNGATTRGIQFKNTVGQASVRDNRFSDCVASFRVEGVQYVNFGRNTHARISKEIFEAPLAVNRMFRCLVERQVFELNIDATGMPQLHSPNDNPNRTPNRIAQTTFESGLFSLASQSEQLQNYTKREFPASTFPSTGIYARFNVDAPGETSMYIAGANEPAVGDYALIGGVSYQFVARVATATWTLRRYDTPSGTFLAGDFTSALNAPQTVRTKYPGWWSN
jgi:hypothetical protein